MTSFKLFAGTDVGLRDNNEDNFTVNPDLTLDEWMVPASQQEAIPLGKRGCLMVVADGMGGMNAGEVASDIAIKTVQELFSPSKIPADVVDKPENIKDYLKKVIIQADKRVKQRCKDDPETEGMGSTIVIAWLFCDNVYVGWLGDSRAYSYIPGKGISRLTKDHSYVQELVDAKLLTEEEAMFHPQSNVIIRSLGDVTQKAKPGVICYPVTKGEIILLCSDGLCGFCSDAEIADIIKKNTDDLRNCKEVLTNAALDAEGSDNITIAILQIVESDGNSQGKNISQNNWPCLFSLQNIIIVFFSLGLVFALGFAGLKSCDFHFFKESVPDSGMTKKDTLAIKLPKQNKKNEVERDGLKKEETLHSSPKKGTLIEKAVNGSKIDDVDSNDKNDEDDLTKSSEEGEGTVQRINNKNKWNNN